VASVRRVPCPRRALALRSGARPEEVDAEGLRNLVLRVRSPGDKLRRSLRVARGNDRSVEVPSSTRFRRTSASTRQLTALVFATCRNDFGGTVAACSSLTPSDHPAISALLELARAHEMLRLSQDTHREGDPECADLARSRPLGQLGLGDHRRACAARRRRRPAQTSLRTRSTARPSITAAASGASTRA